MNIFIYSKEDKKNFIKELSSNLDAEVIAQHDLSALNDFNFDFFILMIESDQEFQFFSKFDHLKAKSGFIFGKNLQEDTVAKTFPNVNFFSSPKKDDDIIKLVSNFLEGDISSHFSYIPIDKFKRINTSNVDIFLKLSNKKFLKVFPQNTFFDDTDIEKYLQKKVSSLYVANEDYKKFQEYYNQTIVSALEENPSQESKLELNIEKVSLIHELTLNIGLSEEVIETMNTLINNNLALLEKHNSNIFHLVSALVERNDYLYEHSLVAAHIAAGIAVEMDWNTETTLQKLSLAALLHDITFQSPELAEVATIDEELEKKVDWRGIKKIRNHPQEGAELIRNSQHLPPDVDTIVLQHHEKPDGSGFPRGLEANRIAPISCIFIIAEDFSNRICHDPKVLYQREKITQDFEQNYNKGNFKRPLQGFLKLIS